MNLVHGFPQERQREFFRDSIRTACRQTVRFPDPDISNMADLMVNVGFHWVPGGSDLVMSSEFFRLANEYSPLAPAPLQAELRVIEICAGLALAELSLFGFRLLENQPGRACYLSRNGARMFRQASALEPDKDRSQILRRTAEGYLGWVQVIAKAGRNWQVNGTPYALAVLANQKPM